MIPVGPFAPNPDEKLESLFYEVLLPPEGYEYYGHDGQILFPVIGSDNWRLLLHKKGTEIAKENLVPVFLKGSFVRKITEALNKLQEALNESVNDDIPEPVTRTPQ